MKSNFVIAVFFMLSMFLFLDGKILAGDAKDNKNDVMAGTWKVSTKATKVNSGGQDISVFTQTRDLVFYDKDERKKKKMDISGSPFGFEIIKSDVQSASKDGKVKFKTSYHVVCDIAIDWEGTLNKEGNKITDGKFSFMLASGTFTAEKVEAEKAKDN